MVLFPWDARARHSSRIRPSSLGQFLKLHVVGSIRSNLEE